MTDVKAVFWDFGGVITSSPFEAFLNLETKRGLPPNAIRTVNTKNPDTNAWAQFERNEINRDAFCAKFEVEAAAMGYAIMGADVLGCLVGAPRPIMARALERVSTRFITACLTNNVARLPRPPEIEAEVERIMGLFGHVIESSKLGFRKPEPRFYRHALDVAGVVASQTVFLDDLGVNLKTARDMGMTTIKVVDPQTALAELGDIIGLDLLSDG